MNLKFMVSKSVQDTKLKYFNFRMTSDDNVKVIVRCRPLNSTEKSNGNKSIVECDENNGQITVTKKGDQPKLFTFDTVFGPESRQVDIYNLTARYEKCS